MSNSNNTNDDKKKIWKAIFAFFVIPNAILVIICAILGYAKWNELKSHWPLFAISGIIVLLILNRICYSLYKAREKRNLTNLDSEVSADQVKSSLKLLRYAAAALAVISFITTAQGLKSFVFPEDGQEWQAYTASFAVQSILLVFNFLFFPFYVRIKKPERFPAFFQHILIYCIVFLFIGSLIVSSTFSYVFIANNTYKVMRAKNSNITIEKFLTEEAYNLSRVNDEIGEKLRSKVVKKTAALERVISENAHTVISSNEGAIDAVMQSFNSLQEYQKVDGEDAFYTQVRLNTDTSTARYPDEYEEIYGTLKEYKKDNYDLTYDGVYNPAYEHYIGLKNASNKSEFTNRVTLTTHRNSLDGEVNRIDNTTIPQLQVTRSRHYDNYVSQYRGNAIVAFGNLRTAMSHLKNFYDAMISVYDDIDESVSDTTANEEKITEIFAFVYNNEYNRTTADRLLDFLSGQREAMRRQNADGAGQSGSTSQPDSTSEPDNPYEELAEFTEDFNSFVNYTELKKQIKDFIDDRLSITYYIKSEGESDPAPSGEGGHTPKTVSKDEWTQERKRDFVEFISCLKGLPDLEQYKEKADASVKNEEEASALMKDYDQQAVLEEAYTLNRDLLENISDFEKAINYFKYDFRLMAVLSAIMALFMDLASFLTGGFMFGASFFDELKKPNKQNKQQTP